MNLVQQSPDVYVAPGPISKIGSKEIALLKSAAMASPRGRVRVNLHPTREDRLHEMFIAIRPDSYIHPHKHLDKSEAFHVVYGAVDIVIFDDLGEILEILELAAGDAQRSFYYRLSSPFYHTLVVRTDVLVVHEITNGPFVPGATLLAPFAPTEDDRDRAAHYRTNLMRRIAELSEVGQL
jgi:cupin fold WbuC family metalloprotein